MKIYAVGIGPGDRNYMAPYAEKIISECEVIIGYTAYLKLIPDLVTGKEVIDTGMKGETARCELAFQETKLGKKVAVVSSGDAGIYGMASLLMEMTENETDIEIEVVPGITACVAAASLLGAPLANDFAVVSLSDLLTSWQTIEKRLEAAGLGDFVVCLYNPGSKTRKNSLRQACEILLKHKNPQTCCGYVRNALRNNRQYQLCSLQELSDISVDMLTTAIVGNSDTKQIHNKLVTTRGYRLQRKKLS
ncbi:MAG: precorrin-3B C(17)-methyltransferase [Planctomycetaceae bacterium]|jgi:precorrin-3B C17-methyltransferase|nr:precorrin-3B C(17)-methyltransferase [Planctomycetaceae bacterium]